MQLITVKQIIDKFKFDVLYKPKNYDNVLHVSGINRAGLELAGFSSLKTVRRIAYLGRKETLYLNSLSESEATKAISNILCQSIPLIILGINFKITDKLIMIANQIQSNSFVIASNLITSDLFNILGVYLEKSLAETIEKHGSLIQIFGVGVMITGDSGIGKSELTLDLLERGHSFVADDRVILSHYGGSLHGKAHPLLKDLLEIKGLGILNIRDIIGSGLIINDVPLFGIVDLINEKKYNLLESKKDNLDRHNDISKSLSTCEILNHNVYYIHIPVIIGRNLVLLTEWAVRFMKDHHYNETDAKKNRISTTDLINQRLTRFLKTK